MKNLLLAVALVFAISNVAVAQDAAAPAAEPAMDQGAAAAPAKDAKKAKKDKKAKKAHKKGM